MADSYAALAAAATLIGDALKGTAAVLIGINITPLGGLVAGLFAFLGPTHQLDPDAENALTAHPWPGNVRELQNAIKRARLLAPNRHVSARVLGLESPPAEFRVNVREPDRREIERALNKTGGVVARAARELGLSRQALYRRMDRLGIREPAPAPNPDC